MGSIFLDESVPACTMPYGVVHLGSAKSSELLPKEEITYEAVTQVKQQLRTVGSSSSLQNCTCILFFFLIAWNYATV